MNEQQAERLAQRFCQALERLAEAVHRQAEALNRFSCVLEKQQAPKYSATTGGKIGVSP